MAFVKGGGKGIAVWGVRGVGGGGGIDGVDCSLPAGGRVSHGAKVEGGRRCVLGQVIGYPVGVLLLKLGHDDNLVAGLGGDGRGSDLIAVADEGHDVC